MAKNKSTSLSWDVFQSMGNPHSVDADNAELSPNTNDKNDRSEIFKSFKVRIWLDTKHRKGKKATIIKGIDLNDNDLKELSKEMKSLCGVGGTAKDGEIIIQGDQRPRILKLLLKKGFSDSKLAGG